MFACVDIVTLDFDPAVIEVSVLVPVKRCHVIRMERIIFIAPLIDPAVGALRTEVCHDVCDVLAGIRRSDLD